MISLFLTFFLASLFLGVIVGIRNAPGWRVLNARINADVEFLQAIPGGME